MPKPLAILNIEDSKNDSDLITRLLKKAGYKVTFKRVENAVQMRAALKKRPWELIISDHNLPKFDSYAALAILREEGLDIPFIVVSDKIGEEAVVNMMKAGAHDYLMKDNLTRLIPAVERELEQAKIRKERKPIESLYRTLAENSIQGVAIFQGQKMVFANPALSRINGYTNKELMAMSAEQIFAMTHPDDRLISEERFKKRMAGEAISPNIEMRILKKDGSTRWVQAFTDQIIYAEQPAVLSTLIDITESKHAEDALHASEKRFRALIENSLDDISLLTADGTLIWESPSVIRNLDYATNEFLGRNIFELIHPDDLAEIQNLYTKLIEEPAGRKSASFRLKRSDGTWRWIEAIATNMLNEVSVEAIVINYRDVTERKQAERRSQTLLEAALDGVLVVNTEGKIFIANTQSETLFGYPLDELIGKPIEMLIPQRFQQNHPGYRENYFAAPRKREMHTGNELFARRRDGSEFPVNVQLNILETEEGAATIAVVRDITEHKQADKALRESESSLEGILQSTADGILAVNLENKVLFTNDRFAELWKIPQEVISSKDDTILLQHVLDQLTHPQEFINKVQKLYKSQEESFDILYFKDGRIFERLSKPIINEESPAGRVWSFRDITERKQAEQKLRDSEERFRELADNIEEVFWVNDSASQEDVYVSPAYERVWGHIPNGVDDFIENVIPEDRLNLIAALEKQKRGEKTEVEYRIQHKDGSVHWVWDRAFPIFDEKGKLIRVAGIATDITERKKIETAYLQSERAYRTLFENVPVGLYRTSIDGQILDANPAVVKMFGYQHKESLLTAHVGDFYVDPAHKKFHDEVVNGDITTIIETEFRKKNGTIFWAEDHIQVVRDEKGNALFYEGSMIDITERKRTDQVLAESEARFRQAITAINAIPYSLNYTPRHYSFIGKGIQDLAGYSYEEITPDLLDTLILESNMLGGFRGVPMPEATRLVREGKSGILWQCEHRIHTRSGGERWLSDSSVQILDEHNIPTGSIGIFQDITERKQAEEKLLESERRYRELYSNMPAMFFTINAEGTTLSVNDFGADQLGYTQSELVGQTVLKVFYEADKEQAVTYVKDCLEHMQQTHQWELRKVRKDGSMLWVKETAWAVINQEGQPIVLIVCEDITERKLAQEVVRENEARYRSLFDDSPVSLWEEDFSAVKRRLDALRNEGVKDLRSYFSKHPQVIRECAELIKILNVNRATLKLFGAKSKDDLAQNIARFMDEDPIELFQNELISIAQGKTQFEWEGINQTLDGRKIIIRLSLSVMPGCEDTYSKVIISMVDITAHIQAEKAIRESEKDLRESQMIAGLGSYVLDIPSEKWTSSDVLNQIFGIEESFTHSTKDWIALIHPDWQQEMYDYLVNEVLGNHIHFDKEYKIIRKNDGSERWVYGLGKLEFDTNNQPAKMRGTIQDITERKEVEEKLHKSEQRYRALFEDMPIAIWDEDFSEVKKHLGSLKEKGINDFRTYFETNPDALRECFSKIRIIDINNAALKMYAANSKEDLYESLTEGPSENESEQFREGLIAVSEGKTSYTWEGTDETVAGEPIEISLSWSVVPGHEADFSKVIVTTVDITERKQAEEKLAQERNLLRLLIDNIPDYIYIKDAQGRKTIANIADWQAAGGKGMEDVVGKSDFDTYPPELAAKFWADDQTVLSSGEPIFNLEEPGQDAHGNPRWILTTKVPLRNAKNQIIGLVGIGRDISERKKTEAENKYQLAELEALYENGLAISRLLEPKQIAQRLVEVIDQKLDWHHAAIRLYDAATDRLELLALNAPEFNEIQIAEQIERINQAINTPDKGLSGWVIRHAEIVRVGNLKNDPRYIETYAGINSGLYIPIKSGEVVIGSIAIESDKENAFTERDEHTLTTLANQAAISFVNARLYLWLQKELDERHLAEEQIRKLNIELEQRVAERTAQIETTKRRLELATHTGEIGVWEYNPRENKVIWDERMYMIHQISTDEFDGTSQTWAKYIHPDDLEKSQINKQLAFTQNLLQNNEYRIILPDGSIRHINTNAVTVFSEDGTAERIIGINMDITERKQIEQSLRDSETYARLLFDTVPDPVSVTDADGVIVDVNKVFETQYNLLRDEIRGKHISELGIYPETDLVKREKYLLEILQGRPAKPIELDIHFPGDRGHSLELHSYLLIVNGRQLVLNTAHDITEYKKAEEIQRFAKSEMEHALRIKNEFLANMSHELRTPLNAILGISESLEEQISGPLNEKQLKYIGIVRESGRHLLELINDILDLSKVEAGRMELDIHHISVEKLCQSSLRMVKELAQKKSLNVSYKINENVKIVAGDERRLKQSLVNLLSNAVKFTPPGSRVGLQVSGNTETNEVEFIVWDQGIGIAQKDIQHLFKPFVQLDAGLAREYQGTGLGLALVSQMIQLHGGHVHVESELNSGSRFIITLPWLPTEQIPKAKVTAELSSTSSRSSGKRNGKILLVEDTDVVVQLISEYLRYKGYEIILAQNGVEGVKIAAQEQPDLILMDVMMPIMDGLEATRQIRMDKKLLHTPIIALTALAMAGDREKCLEAGMDNYLSKPIQMHDLADMIEKYLRPAWDESNEQ